jgi:hypothetical protein
MDASTLPSEHRERIRVALHSAALKQLADALSNEPLEELANSLVICEVFLAPRDNSRSRRKLFASVCQPRLPLSGKAPRRSTDPREEAR